MKSLWGKKIPTIAGVILIVIGVLATTFLTKTGIIFFGGAAPSDTPQDVRVSNITERSITITYATDASVIGSVSIGEDLTNAQTTLDDRDQVSGIPKTYHVHSFTIKNLKPTTTYKFTITSGATTYQNNGTPFTTQTGSEITTPPSSLPAVSGKIIQPDGQVPPEALVFLTTTGGQTLSTLIKSNGVYILPINGLRSQNLSTYADITTSTRLQLLATDSKNIANAAVIVSDANPVPIITLSNTYDFTQTTQPVASESAQSHFPVFPNSTTFVATPIILTPSKDEGFTDAQPQFSGKALPNQKVTVEIHSDTVVTGSVTSNASGQWTYRPTTKLSPGQHTLTITTPDASGILRSIQQSFTVFAEGSQVTQSATPSATLVPTKTPASPTPTKVLSPTPTTVATPTPTPKATQLLLSPTPMAKLPPTGSNTVMIVGLTGLATVAIGIVLFAFTSGVIPL